MCLMILLNSYKNFLHRVQFYSLLTATAPAPDCPCQELVRDDRREDSARSQSPNKPHKPVVFPMQGAPSPNKPRSRLLPDSPPSKPAAPPGPRDRSVDSSSFQVSFQLFMEIGLN